MTSIGPTRPGWSSQTKLVISLLLLALFLFLLSRFRIVIAPLILAVILAYILTPLVNQVHDRLRIPRVLAILISYVIMIVILSLLPLVVIPPFTRQLTDLNVDLQQVIDQVVTLLSNQLVLPGGFIIDSEEIIAQLTTALQTVLEPFFGRTLSLLMDAISSLVWVIFILVVAFYLIKDGSTLRTWFEAQLPPEYRDDILRLREEINKIWAAFFRGQLLLALVVAIIFVVIGFGLGIPFALAMGVLAGLLEFIPSFGHAIWLTAASVLTISVGSTWINVPNWVFMVIVIGLHLVFQQFDLNYLIPRIIGRSVHLPPLVVILGIVAGAAIAGVLGIVLAAPTIASGRIISRYIFANLFDLEPFPVDVAPPLPPPDPDWWRLRGRLETEKVEE